MEALAKEDFSVSRRANFCYFLRFMPTEALGVASSSLRKIATAASHKENLG